LSVNTGGDVGWRSVEGSGEREDRRDREPVLLRQRREGVCVALVEDAMALLMDMAAPRALA